MKELLNSHSFLTHLAGIFGIIGGGLAVPNSPILSLAVAAVTGITQAAHAYAKVKTQQSVQLSDTGIRLPPPTLTNAAGDAAIADHGTTP